MNIRRKKRLGFLDQGLSKEDKQDLAAIGFMFVAIVGAAISVIRYLRLVFAK